MSVSENILIAVISGAASIFVALITAFGAIVAAHQSNKQVTCSVVGLAASAGGFVGLIVGLVVSTILVQRPSSPTPESPAVTVLETAVIPAIQPSEVPPTVLPPQPTEPTIPATQPPVPTPTAIVSQAPQTSPQSLGTILVRGNSKEGERLRIEKSGVYRLEYRGGSYSTYAEGRSPGDLKTWLTAVFAFDGSRPQWDGERIKQEDILFRLADTGYWSSGIEAENSAQGRYIEKYLNAGQVITLVVVDSQSAYEDNPGHIMIEYFYVGE